MTKAAVTDWSTTAANNTDINDIAIGNDALAPGNVDNVVRELMAQVAAFQALLPKLAAGNIFTATQTISNVAPELRFTDTNGSATLATANLRYDGGQFLLQIRDNNAAFVENSIVISHNASGATGFSFNIGSTQALAIEAAGPTITDPQAAVTLEKLDARFVSTATATSATNFPLMMPLHVTDGFVPDRNEAVSVYKRAGSDSAYTINLVNADGSALPGTWRCVGGVTGNFTVVRTA